MKNKLILLESEKNRILEMHKNAILKENKNFLSEAATLKQIQQLLVDKGIMPATLPNGKTSVDNNIGPVTLEAIYSALTQTQGTQTQGGTNTQGGANTQGGTNTGTPTGTQNANETMLEVGKVYEGTYVDNAQGKVLKVLSITPIKGCDVKEVALKMTEGAGYTYYGYLQGSDLTASNMKRTGEGAKSQNPCEEIKQGMMSFGVLEPEGTMKKLGIK